MARLARVRARVQATEQAARRATARGRALRPPGLRFSVRCSLILPCAASDLARLKLDAFALRHERPCSAGQRGATGAARNPLDFSAGWIARRRSISHARYLTNRLACPMTLALPQAKSQGTQRQTTLPQLRLRRM